MDAQLLIEQAATAYRFIDRLGMEIEQAIRNNTFSALPDLCAQLNQAQDDAKILDRHLLDLMRQRQELQESAATEEWLRLMRSIHDRNQRLLPHLNSIMAVQRNELLTLKKGASVLHGYRPNPVQTGRRISSAG